MRYARSFGVLSCLGLLVVPAARAQDRPDVVFADFESTTYAPWQADGTAFGEGPASGALPGQMAVGGFRGNRLVNSFHGGDATTGTLTSPEFRVDRRYINGLIGGGGFAGTTCVNLLVDGKVVRTAVGPNTEPGGSEELLPMSWDVADLAGKTAKIQVVDRATGGWGHINVDQIVFSDKKASGVLGTASREIVAQGRYLHIPVRRGAPKRTLTVGAGGREEQTFSVELAEGAPEWWAYLDISAWRGRPLVVRVSRVPEDSNLLASLEQGDSIRGTEDLYREPLRPQLHFSPLRGWTNDPNGLVYLNGEYHLYFQHNPYGWDWGNMHWGHAVSRDLVHWEERGEALYPDSFGPMFSGSAVVDWKNTSGLGRGGTPPLLLFYTAAGNPTVQCLASSTDGGKTVVKYDGNPIVGQFTPGNRDPKVLWHEPTGRWVMTLYVERSGKHTIQFLSSTDAIHWKDESAIDGFFECPDLFPLRVDGDPARTLWVLTAADSGYMLGAFDGKRFTPETPKLPGQRGRGFYAAQTYSDIPASDGRRLQFGWLQAPSPGMSFNQCMSLPLELTLRSTPEGPRLAWQPAKELEALRAQSHSFGPLTLDSKTPKSLDAVRGELLEVRAEFEAPEEGDVRFDVRGIPVAYLAKSREIEVNGHKAPAPTRDGKVRLALYTDRTSIEVFVGDGLTYVPMPVIAKPEALTVSVRREGEPVRFTKLDVHALKSIWGDRAAR